MPLYSCRNRRCPRVGQLLGIAPAPNVPTCRHCGRILVQRTSPPDDPPHPEEDQRVPRGHFYDLLRREPETALVEVTARRELHWARFHPGAKPEEVGPVPGCVVCLVIEGQQRRPLEVARGE